MKYLTRLVCYAFTAAALNNAASARGTEFDTILRRLPDGANVLVMLNAEKIFDSDVATLAGWRQQYESDYAKTPLRMPPEAQQFVLAAELELSSLTPRWESSAMLTSADIPISVVQRLVRGRPDRFGDLNATVSPRGTYVVRFAAKEYGMIHAGDRQAVARWLDGQRSRAEPPLSKYLAEAAAYPDRSGTEIIMAIDLADALGQDAVESAVAGSAVLTEGQIEKRAASAVLASVRGATLGVRVTDKLYGSLKVDFSKPIAPIEAVAKPLLLEALEEAGASIDEFYDWKLEVSARSFRISGTFTDSGLRRIFSFLEIDATAVGTSAGDLSDQADGGAADRYGVDVDKTKDYFEAVEGYLDDLSGETGAKSYYSIATWFEKYAKRIDRLPILGVDRDLVDYGAYTVSQLLDCVEAIRGAGIRTSGRAATVTGGNAGSSYGYGGRTYTNSLFAGSMYDDQLAGARAAEAERRSIRRQERATSSTTVRGLLRELRDQTSSIRRGLTERYQREF